MVDPVEGRFNATPGWVFAQPGGWEYSRQEANALRPTQPVTVTISAEQVQAAQQQVQQQQAVQASRQQQAMSMWRYVVPENNILAQPVPKQSPVTTPPTKNNDLLGVSGVPVMEMKPGSGFGVFSDQYSRAAAGSQQARLNYEQGRAKLKVTTLPGVFDVAKEFFPERMMANTLLGTNQKANDFLFSSSVTVAAKASGQPPERLVSSMVAFRDTGRMGQDVVQPVFAQKINPAAGIPTGPTRSAPERFARNLLSAPVFEPATVAGNVMVGVGLGGVSSAALPLAGARIAAMGPTGVKAVAVASKVGWPLVGAASAGVVGWETYLQPKGTRAEFLGKTTGSNLIPGMVGFSVGYNPEIVTRPMGRIADSFYATKNKAFPLRATTKGVIEPEIVGSFTPGRASPGSHQQIAQLLSPGTPAGETSLIRVTPKYTYAQQGSGIKFPNMKDISPVYEATGPGEYVYRGITSSEGPTHTLATVFQRVKEPVIVKEKAIDLSVYNEMVNSRRFLPGRTSENYIFGGQSLRDLLPKGSTRTTVTPRVTGSRPVGKLWYESITDWSIESPAVKQLILFDGLVEGDALIAGAPAHSSSLLPKFIQGKQPSTIRIKDPSVTLKRTPVSNLVGDVGGGVRQMSFMKQSTAPVAEPMVLTADQLPTPTTAWLLKDSGRGFDMNKIAVGRASRLTGDVYLSSGTKPKITPERIVSGSTHRSSIGGGGSKASPVIKTEVRVGPVLIPPVPLVVSRVSGNLLGVRRGARPDITGGQIFRPATRQDTTPDKMVFSGEGQKPISDTGRDNRNVVINIVTQTQRQDLRLTQEGIYGGGTTETPLVPKTPQPPMPKPIVPPPPVFPSGFMGGGRGYSRPGWYRGTRFKNPVPTIASVLGNYNPFRKGKKKRRKPVVRL